METTEALTIPRQRKPRTRMQFRLTWLRQGQPQVIDGHTISGDALCTKTFPSREKAERYVRILTSKEPWREWAPNKGPDDWACCPGTPYDECGCGGYTNAQVRDEKRKDLPPIAWVRIEQRTITATPFELISDTALDTENRIQEPSNHSKEEHEYGTNES